MAIYQTEYGNFGSPEDLLRYMQEEGIKAVHLTLIFCGKPAGKSGFEMTLQDVKRWTGRI